MEFYHLKTHLMGNTRPMLAGRIEYTEQKLVLTRLLIQQVATLAPPILCYKWQKKQGFFQMSDSTMSLSPLREPGACSQSPWSQAFQRTHAVQFLQNYLELLFHIVKYISFYKTMPMAWHGPNYSPCPGPMLMYQQSYLLLSKPYSGVSSHLEFCLQDKAHNLSALLICIKLLIPLLHNKETWYQSILNGLLYNCNRPQKDF